MFLSIFSDELRLDVEQAFPVIRSWGLEHVDLRGLVFRKGCERLTKDELGRVKALLDANGLKLGAFQSSVAKVHLPDKERQAAELEKLEGLVRAADVLGCRLVRSFNFWQPKGDEKGRLAVQPDQMQLVLDTFEPVAKRAREAGLVLAFENCGQTCAEVAALLDALAVPEWGLAWDACNGWDSDARERDETEYLVANARRARMLHVKAASAIAELGGTVIPWDRILATCSAAGLGGPVSVETHNPSGSPLSHEDASRKTVEFVKKSWPTAAPGDVYAAARPAAKGEVHRSYEKNPVGFVVVGLGMGHGRSKTVTQTPGAKLVGVCDLREERAARSGEAFEVKHTTDLEPWLADPEVEVVYVLTETGNHGKVAMRALEAGKHVMTTKPMDASVRACDEMVRLAEEKGLTLAVDFGRRFESELLSLRAAVRSGFFEKMLGGTLTLKILRTMKYFRENGGWRGTRELDGGGVLSNQCIHEIDTVAFCLGVPKRVKCDIWTQAHEIEAEDLGCATWLYEDGAVIHHYATSSYPFPTWYSRLELHGTEGAYVAERGGPSGQKRGALYFKGSEWTDAPPESVEPEWQSAADNFAAALRTGAKLVCDGRDGRRTQSILEAMYVSAYDRSGGWVDVEPEVPGA
ncbi:MAG: Gfo/Idh/MocA family oxidoreductase [Planctomycetota bacterium]